MPLPTPSEIISSRLTKLDSQLIQVVDALTDEEASKWPAETAPSCKWHLWHMARWADYVQSLLSPVVDEKTPELWEFSGVADEWGFDGVDLGMWGAGSGLGNENGKSLPLPSVPKVRAYAKESFELLEIRVGKLDDTTFNAPLTSILSGLAFVDHIKRPGFWKTINGLGEVLFGELQQIAARSRVPVVFQHHGSRFGIIFGTREPVTNYQQALVHNPETMLEFCRQTTRRGVYFHDYGGSPCHHGYSLAHSLKDIHQALSAIEDSLQAMG